MIDQHLIKKEVVNLWNSVNEPKITLSVLEEVYYKDSNHAITKFYIDNYEKAKSIAVKIKFDNNENAIKTLLGDNVICNQQTNTCPLCFVNNKFVDGFLFFLNYDINELNEYLSFINKPVVVTEDTIKQHKHHIFIDNNSITNSKKEVIQAVNESIEFSNIENSNDLDIMKSRINILNALLRKLEKENKTFSREYKDASDTLQRFIDMKNRITEGEKLQINGKLDISDVIKRIITD